MKQIRLRNKRRRTFNCDLETQPDKQVQAIRTQLDPKTGVTGMRFVDYQTYKNLTLQWNEVSALVDESILDNASVRGAVKEKWLQVVR